MTEKNVEITRDLNILDCIEKNPNSTQASLASQLNVAIGNINLHLKRLTEKGFIKIQHSEKRKLIYIITPEGISLRVKLTNDYINNSLELYRLIRKRIIDVLNLCDRDGFKSIYIDGSGDIEEICKLSCIERGIQPLKAMDAQFPVVRISGVKLFYDRPKGKSVKEE